MNWSRYQTGIFNWAAQGRDNAIVNAVAGSGKTTTIVETLRRTRASHPTLLAFNRAIAEELKRRVPDVSVSTFHGLCLGALSRCGGVSVVPDKLRKLAKDLAGELNIPLTKRSDMVANGRALVGRAKNAGIGILQTDTPRVWRELAAGACLDHDRDSIDFARLLLQRSRERRAEVDFDDMLDFFLLRRPRIQRFDFVAVDEAQDLNPVQHEIIKRILHPDGRLVAVGDPRQAIYAFRGADAQSFARIASQFECRELPLTISYRCSRAVVQYARQIVPYLEHAPDAPEGEVKLDVRPTEPLRPGGEVVLCRNNAPLVKLALSMIAGGVGIKIIGRDLAEDLKKQVRKSRACSLTELRAELDDWREYERARFLANDMPEQADFVDDRYQCLLAVIESLSRGAGVEDVVAQLDYLFNDRAGVVELSTVHRAKGREWERVFILRPGLTPAPWAKTPAAQEQERNLQYVAFTRAKHGLYLLDDTIERAL